jgi:hypothetical protein
LNRIHVSVASVIVGLAAIFGLAATTKTVGIGEAKPAASQVSNQTIAARKRKLRRAQVALRKARAQKPPPLPATPRPPISAPRAQLVAQPASVLSAPSTRSFSDDDDHSDDHHEDDDD